MKRLLASTQLPYNLGTCLQEPDLFYSACDTARLMSGLGYKWDNIKTKLINQFEPYTYAHPDLEMIQMALGINK